VPAPEIVDLLRGSVASLQMVGRFRNSLQLASAGPVEKTELSPLRVERF
jgi:hypothetical protein